MIPLFTTTHVTSSIVACDLKEVRCEHCGIVYHYEHRAAGHGQGISIYGLDDAGAATRAVRSAQTQARSVLRKRVAPVACPGCSRLQSGMVPELRRIFLRRFEAAGLVIPGVVILLAAGIAALCTGFFDEPLTGAALAWTVLLGGSALILFIWLGARPWVIAHGFTDKKFDKRLVPVGTAGQVSVAKVADAAPEPAAAAV